MSQPPSLICVSLLDFNHLLLLPRPQHQYNQLIPLHHRTTTPRPYFYYNHITPPPLHHHHYTITNDQLPPPVRGHPHSTGRRNSIVDGQQKGDPHLVSNDQEALDRSTQLHVWCRLVWILMGVVASMISSLLIRVVVAGCRCWISLLEPPVTFPFPDIHICRTTLYVTMGIASYRVFQMLPLGTRQRILPAFFKARDPEYLISPDVHVEPPLAPYKVVQDPMRGHLAVSPALASTTAKSLISFRGLDQPGTALTWYAAQMLLNYTWCPLFFGLKQFGASLVSTSLLWIALGVRFIVVVVCGICNLIFLFSW